MGVIKGADKFVAKVLEDFQANLQYIRGKRGCSYRDLGLRSGMTERNAYMIVTGKQGATTKTLAFLAQALQVPVSDLFMPKKEFTAKYRDARELAPFVLTNEAMREYALSA